MKAFLSAALVACVAGSAGAFAQSTSPMPASAARIDSATVANGAAAADTKPDATPSLQSRFGAVAGKTFYALDGSSITLSFVEGGFDREITSAGGAVTRMAFEFLAPQLGAVSDGSGSGVVGMFRLTDQGIVSEYADGHSETLVPNDGGGVSMTVAGGPSGAVCTSWYPQGHTFSLDERKAALAAYADKLGLGEGPVAPRTCAASPASGAAAQDKVAANAVVEHLPKLTPLPRPALPGDKSATAFVHAAFAAPPADSRHVIDVRDSVVHAIDPPLPSPNQPIAGGQNTATAGPPASPNASTCLEVESDGQHWGFRNRCAYDVQFAYCLMNSAEALASCGKGGVTGSVAPNGTSALVSDKSLGETNADHDFRWVACAGGAGEVAVHLDRADPPVGRCEKPNAS